LCRTLFLSSPNLLVQPSSSSPLLSHGDGDGGGGNLLAASPLSTLSLCSAATATKEAAASLDSLAQVTVDEDGQQSPELVSGEVERRRTKVVWILCSWS
ncbi:hypothetical protein LINGRAHAP2_LOCUS7456, partial [Linum grandiflorum]